MSLAAGKLRHRVTIQYEVETQDASTGAVSVEWVDEATVWAAIEPLSAKEFVAAQKEDSKISARVVMRYRVVDAKKRLYHAAKNKYYDIHGALSDKDSGLEYITIPVSEGLKYQEGNPSAVLPVNLVLPVISGNAVVGDTLSVDNGTWANNPDSYSYQWYANSVAISGATSSSYLLTAAELGDTIYCEVSAINDAGSVAVNTLATGVVTS